DLENRYGLPLSVEVFKNNSESVVGRSESGVIVEQKSSSATEGGYLILEFDENAKKMIDLSRQNDVYTVVEKTAAFPDGMTAFYDFLKGELTYPAEVRSAGIQGKVFVEFIIEPDGSITNVLVKKGVHPKIDEEAVRAMKLSPRWNPGTHKGVAVRQKMIIPINFSLDS